MSGDNVKEHERQKIGGLLGAAIANIVPQSMREDFMANYNCKPPPIFMIFISIVEVYNCEFPTQVYFMIFLCIEEVTANPLYPCMHVFHNLYKYFNLNVLCCNQTHANTCPCRFISHIP